jgi:leader peptidase (prepilin peptidase) / N-methyltransferase
MEALLTIIFTLLGLAIGSFLNVVIDRLPEGKSLVRPPSHCDSCGQALKVTDLVPVISYLRRRGRCAYCGAAIPRRVLLVEIAAGALFGLAFWHYGLSLDFAAISFYGCLFLVIAVIDIDTGLILNKIIFPMMVAALLINFLVAPWGWPSGFFGAGALSGLLGGAAGFILLLIVALIVPQGMGMGDVKMAALIGMATGFPLVFVGLFCGIVAGGLVAIALVVFRKRGRKTTMPFGPYLALGAMITLVWGTDILGWYLSLL